MRLFVIFFGPLVSFSNVFVPQSRGQGGYHDDRSGYGDYYYYDYAGDDRASRHRGGGYYDSGGGGGGGGVGGWRGHQRYRTERSDSESEPLSYNSRPQSYYTDRCVRLGALPLIHRPIHSECSCD